MKRILAATATLSLLAVGGPALAAKAPVHGACKAPAGATVLKPGAALEKKTGTPVGAFNEGPTEKVGTFVVDLSGKPASTTSKLALTISWANPVSDYDIIVGGTNDEDGDNPETRVVKTKHCKPVEVGISTYIGVPVDEITLKAKAS